MFGTEQCALSTDEAWRTQSIATGESEPAGSVEDVSFATKRNISTFDDLTHALKMFDADDIQNWRILGLTSMLLVADTIAIALE